MSKSSKNVFIIFRCFVLPLLSATIFVAGFIAISETFVRFKADSNNQLANKLPVLQQRIETEQDIEKLRKQTIIYLDLAVSSDQAHLQGLEFGLQLIEAMGAVLLFTTFLLSYFSYQFYKLKQRHTISPPPGS